MFVLAIAALLGSGQTPPSDETITITGTRFTPAEARARAAEFVERMGIGEGDRPVARWADPVCPNVQGVDESLANRVEARMREIARGSGIAVAGPGCQTNIVVRFGTDAGQIMRGIAEARPRYLEDMSPTARDALFTGGAPIRWTYASETWSDHGMRSSQAGGLAWVSIDGGQGGAALGNIPATMSYNSSMISTRAVRVLTGAAVVVDVDLADGHTLDAVADYVAFVAFAELRVGEPAPRGSVLALFEENGTHALTDWDRAFLTALYRVPLDRLGRRHRGMLVRDLVAAARDAGRNLP